MIVDVLKEAILQNIGPLKDAPKGWKKRCCMMCMARGHGQDKRNRFGIRFEPNSISVNCFNCGYSSGYTEGKDLSRAFEFFLTHINIDKKFIDYIKFEIFKNKNKLQETRDGQVGLESVRSLMSKWTPHELPEDSLSVLQWLEYGITDESFLKVVDYAIRRNLYDLDKFYWSPSTKNHMCERLIIPYWYRNEIVGFTSRLCYDLDDKSVPKYYQQCPNDFVYNLDKQVDETSKYIVVTEGVLDAWVTNGIGILGEITQPKIDIINSFQKDVIVCPDRDKKGGDLVEVAIENDWLVAFPRWEDGIKDAAKASEKYGRLLTLYSILTSARKGRVRIETEWKLEQYERERKRN